MIFRRDVSSRLIYHTHVDFSESAPPTSGPVVLDLGDVDELGLVRRARHGADGLAEVVVADGTARELRGGQRQRGRHLLHVVDIAAKGRSHLRIACRTGSVDSGVAEGNAAEGARLFQPGSRTGHREVAADSPGRIKGREASYYSGKMG